jgi:hypothetical protein
MHIYIVFRILSIREDLDKICTKNQNRYFISNGLFPKKRTIYEIMWKKHKIRCCISTATMLRERATSLHSASVACLVAFKHWRLANRKLGNFKYNVDVPTTVFCRGGKRCRFYTKVPVLNCTQFYAEFLGAFAKLKNVNISFIMPVSPSGLPSAHLSAWNNSASTGRILMNSHT